MATDFDNGPWSLGGLHLHGDDLRLVQRPRAVAGPVTKVSERSTPRSRWSAETWNRRNPVGMPVEYRAIWGRAVPTRITRTRSEAWTQPDGHPVVLIDGQAGAVALWALEPNPLRLCATCDQRRRGAKDDPTVCSHCRVPF